MLEHNLVLKSDELYLVGDSNTDGSGEPATGLYVRDTRHLSRFRLTLNDIPLDRLSARTTGPATALIVEANGPLLLPDAPPAQPHTVAVEQHVELDTALRVRIALRNFGLRALPLTLAIRLTADFRDLFDIRGFRRPNGRGEFVGPTVRPETVVLGYVGLDGARAETAIAFDRPAQIQVIDPANGNGNVAEAAVLLPGFDDVRPRHRPPEPPSAVASFSTILAAGQTWELSVTVNPLPVGGVPISAVATLADGLPPRPATVTTDNPLFNRVLDRSASDLALLQTSFPEGSLPAAGIPWYVAPFGRDSLIVGLQTYHLAPRRAAGTLRVLAALQGTKEDPFHEEEPGKILHEVRYGEMARLGEVPHAPYYGTVDATPLFVMLFADTVAWSGDEQLYRDLLPHVRRALEWIERFGDADGDGLVEYRSRPGPGSHIIHQGWKDSFDSLHHRDGRPATGAIALVEVQGYVFAAYRRLANIAAAWGDPGWADHLRGQAEAVRRTVEDAFWMPEEGYYAQALDGEKTPVRAVSSNPGHLLFCGLPSPERASAVAARLLQPDLDSGWGLRTLGSAMPTYNPMSYHNGSVWPHDNSLIAAGLAAYGHAAEGIRIASALFAAAETDALARLPELYCGFARGQDASSDAPVAYPVSCSPQAWAAAASQLLVRSMLNMRIDIEQQVLAVDPVLPPWLNEIAVRDLHVFGRTINLAVRRSGNDYVVETDGQVRDPRPSRSGAIVAEEPRTAAAISQPAPDLDLPG